MMIHEAGELRTVCDVTKCIPTEIRKERFKVVLYMPVSALLHVNDAPLITSNKLRGAK